MDWGANLRRGKVCTYTHACTLHASTPCPHAHPYKRKCIVCMDKLARSVGLVLAWLRWGCRRIPSIRTSAASLLAPIRAALTPAHMARMHAHAHTRTRMPSTFRRCAGQHLCHYQGTKVCGCKPHRYSHSPRACNVLMCVFDTKILSTVHQIMRQTRS